MIKKKAFETKKEREVRLKVLNASKKRHCGSCKACCIVLDIGEPLNKPRGEPCKHLCDKGCSIYDKRPTPCREYLCAWKMGFVSEEFHPDETNIMLQAATTSEGHFIDVYYLREPNEKTHQLMEEVKGLSKRSGLKIRIISKNKEQMHWGLDE